MNNFNTTDELVTYLNNTLIPDLRESGSDATADDFEDAVEAIATLKAAANRAAWAVQDIVTDFDGMKASSIKGVLTEVFTDLFETARPRQ